MANIDGITKEQAQRLEEIFKEMQKDSPLAKFFSYEKTAETDMKVAELKALADAQKSASDAEEK